MTSSWAYVLLFPFFSALNPLDLFIRVNKILSLSSLCLHNLSFKSISFVSLFQKWDVIFWTSIKLLMKYRVAFWFSVSFLFFFLHQPMPTHFWNKKDISECNADSELQRKTACVFTGEGVPQSCKKSAHHLQAQWERKQREYCKAKGKATCKTSGKLG